MLETLTKDTWDKYLNQTFQIEIAEGQALPLILDEVSGYGRNSDASREAYTLLFHGPLQPILPQRIYRMANQLMGEMDIFLVPIGMDSVGMRYEAIFS